MSTGRVLGRVLVVCTGQAVPYARGARSAIAKQARTGPVFCGVLGLAGDEQGDLRVHGGPDKAVHHYASEHYAAWRQELGASGGALLEVSQARQPCWKLGERLGRSDMAKRLQNSRRTGWYYRVLEEGALWAGAELVLQKRPHPQWSLARLLDMLYRPSLDAAELRAALALPLPPRRLDSGAVESWASRLDGPAQT